MLVFRDLRDGAPASHSHEMIERPLGSRAAPDEALGEQEARPARPGSATDEHSRGSSALGVRRRRVLFALTELEYPTPSLRRVAAVATAIEGDLFILRVLPPLRFPAPRPLLLSPVASKRESWRRADR